MSSFTERPGHHSNPTQDSEDLGRIPKDTFEIEEPGFPTRPLLWERSSTFLARSLPKTHGVLSRAFRYIRGPAPPISLPAPTPWLNIDRRIKSHTLHVPLEASLIRATRPLTSVWLLLLFGVAYIVSLAFFVRAQAYVTPADDFMSCLSTFWLPLNGCGIDGQQCAPFNDTAQDFRCPAACSSVILANLRTVGNEQPIYVPLVVGGGDVDKTYRGDSFICAAAVHAGVIDDSKGGCGSLTVIGSFTNFLNSTANGLTSTPFPSIFPVSFRFSSETSLSNCFDLRWDALPFNIIITALIFLVLRPKAIVLFWSLVCIGFWHITFFSDPRDSPPPIADAFRTFLPVLFICYAFWRVAWRYSLPHFANLPIERMVWYLGPFWTGVLFNLSIERIPIDRLLASDLQRPGAITGLVIICIVCAIVVVFQALTLRKSGWLLYYLGNYIIAILALTVIACLPGLIFRLHHYFAAIAIMPLSAFPTRLSAVMQAFCLGMFLQGSAKFDLDSIYQTASQLQRDAAIGSSLGTFLTNATTYNASIPLNNQTLSWAPFPNTDEGWNGFSLLVDDVERFAGLAFNFSLQALEVGIPHFFRLALQKDGNSGDYTMPAIIWPNGTFSDPLPGPS